LTRRRAVSVPLATILSLVLASQVLAMNASTPVAMRRNYCHRNFVWQGMPGVDWGPNHPVQSKGTFDFCLTLYQLGTVDSNNRVQEGDSTADYYIVDQTVEWTVSYDQTNGTYAPSYDNYAKLTDSSSISAISGVYQASPKTVTSSSCQPFSVGATFGFMSVSVTETLCNSATLRRDSYGPSSAQWSTANLVRTPDWELTYMLKVPQGAKPTFTSKLYYPHYTTYNTGTIRCMYYCYPVWGTTKTVWVDSWVITAP
jgi:hypothetical protein